MDKISVQDSRINKVYSLTHSRGGVGREEEEEEKNQKGVRGLQKYFILLYQL